MNGIFQSLLFLSILFPFFGVGCKKNDCQPDSYLNKFKNNSTDDTRSDGGISSLRAYQAGGHQRTATAAKTKK